jgi:hypothetical protein
MKQLWLGSQEEYLADIAKSVDQNSVLITDSNYAEWLLSKQSGYTSLADLSDAQTKVWNCISISNCVHYCPPKNWNDDNLHTMNDRYILEPIIIYGSNFTSTSGLEYVNASHCTIPKIKSRVSEEKQLWIAGCSFSQAIGVSETENYGYLIGKHLNLPVTNIARHGSDICWSADQILRSDIVAEDIVVWGITHWERFTYAFEGELEFVNPRTNTDKANKLNFSQYELFSENNLHNQLCSILQVENFCKKVGATLKCYNMFPKNNATTRFLSNKYYNISRHYLPEFETLLEKFEDVGTDNLHPGPLTHQKYAKEIIKSLHL